jgi:hypothetical protein
VIGEPWFPGLTINTYKLPQIQILPYSTISSHLMSQSSVLHKWKSWGYKPFTYTIQWRQMRWIERIRKAVIAW